jgi:hypothetical protein
MTRFSSEPALFPVLFIQSIEMKKYQSGMTNAMMHILNAGLEGYELFIWESCANMCDRMG